jgi:signal transduction histidine kinase
VPHGRVFCVLSTATRTFTYMLQDNNVTFRGEGDSHDTKFNHYRRNVNLQDGYTVTLYPSQEMFVQYVTDTPRNMCIIVVFMIAFAAFLVFFYAHLVQRREKKFTEEVKHSFAGSAARDAVLLAKKVYVRYISHEIRTPLNAAYLGLKILEKELAKKLDVSDGGRLDHVRDIIGNHLYRH